MTEKRNKEMFIAWIEGALVPTRIAENITNHVYRDYIEKRLVLNIVKKAFEMEQGQEKQLEYIKRNIFKER